MTGCFSSDLIFWKAKSTGPRTDSGRARSALNSTKHGLLGRFRLVEGEDEKDFSNFVERTRAAFNPEGAVEECLVDRWIKDTWLLARLDGVESALLVNDESLADMSLDDVLNTVKLLDDMSSQRLNELLEIGKYAKSTKVLSEEARSDRKIVEFASLEEILLLHLSGRLCTAMPAKGAPSAETVVDKMAQAFVRNRGAVALALRYRAKIERSRDNALHELQRFQAARHGQSVAPPEVVDVNVNVSGGDERKPKITKRSQFLSSKGSRAIES